MHDLYIAGRGGIDFRFGTDVASTLSGLSDRRISAHDKPTPTTDNP